VPHFATLKETNMSEAETTPTLEERVSKILADEIRPALQRDGGDIELIGVEGGEVKVQLRGACVGCPGAQMTLRMGVERRLRELLPEIERVVPV
jgi:Fe-S cluster biogenesis protein NfuA